LEVVGGDRTCAVSVPPNTTN